MSGRRWTKEEETKLEEMIGTFTVQTIANRLGRSFSSVNLKVARMGIGGFEKNTDLLTVNQIHFMLGVEHRTIYMWKRHGLKIMRKGNYTVVSQENLVKFLKANQDLWNAKRVKDDVLLLGKPWYQEKRKRDVLVNYNWTMREEALLQKLRHDGYSIREIAEKMNRSQSSIKYKLYGANRKPVSKATEQPENIKWQEAR